MSVPILCITLALMIVISSATCSATNDSKYKSAPKPEVKSSNNSKPCCCCNGFSSLGGPDQRFERAMRDITQYALWKFHTFQLQEPMSQNIQMNPSTTNQMVPMAQASQLSPMMINPGHNQLPQANSVIQGQQKNNLGPLGMRISNGLVDMGAGLNGMNFGMDQKTLRDLMDATANLYGRAGVSMGINP